MRTAFAVAIMALAVSPIFAADEPKGKVFDLGKVEYIEIGPLQYRVKMKSLTMGTNNFTALEFEIKNISETVNAPIDDWGRVTLCKLTDDRGREYIADSSGSAANGRFLVPGQTTTMGTTFKGAPNAKATTFTMTVAKTNKFEGFTVLIPASSIQVEPPKR